MNGKVIAGIVGFVVFVIFVQSCLLGGDDDPLVSPGESGAAPTATLPAQLPEAVLLGEGTGGGATGGAGTTTGGGTYVVKSGDTLGSIAAGFNIAPEAQAAWITEVLRINNIEDARLIQVGQELNVPQAPAAVQPTVTPRANGTPSSTQQPGASATPRPGATAAVSPTRSAAGGGGTYVVVSGDTPLGIAEKHCVEGAAAWVNELVALNDIDASNLGVGDELELPAGTPAQCVANNGASTGDDDDE